MTTRYVFVGNPGVGKSAMLNSLVGAPKFHSDFNAGAGLTKALQQEQIGTDIFMDTPGLADTELAPLAAGAITEAFKLGGRFKVFFVFTLEAGRVRPEDKSTMELILKAVPEIGSTYGLILNKVSPKAVSNIQEKQETDKILAALFAGVQPTVFVNFNLKDRKYAQGACNRRLKAKKQIAN